MNLKNPTNPPPSGIQDLQCEEHLQSCSRSVGESCRCGTAYPKDEIQLKDPDKIYITTKTSHPLTGPRF